MDDLERRNVVESSLRPITTIGYKKGWQENAFDFPTMYGVPSEFPIMLYTPVSSYTIDRNERFAERYKNFNSST
jgi:hypothetical protein